MLVGFGYDVHKFIHGRRLVLGGVDIPFEKGLLGHSDADVLIHAVMDALLGAAGLGDIGLHFPDSDIKYKGISSSILLSEVVSLLAKDGYAIGNIDVTLVAQEPKLSPYRVQIQERLAELLAVNLKRVNIKATTTEGLGFTGRGEGVAAYAVCTIIDKTDRL